MSKLASRSDAAATEPLRRQSPAPARVAPVGLLLAAAAAVWHGSLLTRATNDNFLHMTLAQQVLAGDWPVRDFFDHGWVLQYMLSAGAELLFGHRLLSEAIVVGVAWAISTYVVFVLVRRLGGSSLAASASALMLIVCSARGYSYPKGIVYAVAALLWWRYVDVPTARRAVALGVWTAVAFYWRPDHGVLVAFAVVLAALAAHGLTPLALVRCCYAGVTTIALILPFLIYVQAVLGIAEYAQTGIVQAEVEHTSQGPHEWPVLRFAPRIVTVTPPEVYAPRIAIRWNRTADAETRARVISQYGLTQLADDGDGVTRLRLSQRSLERLRELINEPSVDDTGGIDRSSATLERGTWPRSRRLAFEHAMLRLRLLPDLDSQERTTELAVALLYIVPLGLLLTGAWVRRRLPPGTTAASLAAFAVFALAVDVAMLRHPFTARAPDGVVLPAIAFGCWVAALWGQRGGRLPRLVFARMAAVALMALGIVTIAGAGQFAARAGFAGGRLPSPERVRADWAEMYRELAASPPLAYYLDHRARTSLRFAAYLRECLPANERALVLWFEPEIYYYSGRLMAQRHLVFPPAWSSLDEEQRLTLEKVRRFAPSIVLARRSALDAYARATYPPLVAHVERDYRRADTFDDQGEQYLVLVRRDRAPVRRFGARQWPCYSSEPSPWWRVGRAAD